MIAYTPAGKGVSSSVAVFPRRCLNCTLAIAARNRLTRTRSTAGFPNQIRVPTYGVLVLLGPVNGASGKRTSGWERRPDPIRDGGDPRVVISMGSGMSASSRTDEIDPDTDVSVRVTWANSDLSGVRVAAREGRWFVSDSKWDERWDFKRRVPLTRP